MACFTNGSAINPYDGLDEATTRAILEVQLADLADAEAQASTPGLDHKDRDAALAASLLRQNLESVRNTIADRCMTQSIAHAVVADGGLVTIHAQVEGHSRRIQDMVQQLETGGRPQLALPEPPSTPIDADTLAKLGGLFMSERSGRALMPLPTLIQETVRSNGSGGPRVKRHDCAACGDVKSYFEVFKLPCNDEYCQNCLRGLFEKSYTDESLFPPRCCRQVIPINAKDINLFLDKEIRDKYEPRRVEVATADRTYCSTKTCSTFVPPLRFKTKSGFARSVRLVPARVASVLRI